MSSRWGPDRPSWGPCHSHGPGSPPVRAVEAWGNHSDPLSSETRLLMGGQGQEVWVGKGGGGACPFGPSVQSFRWAPSPPAGTFLLRPWTVPRNPQDTELCTAHDRGPGTEQLVRGGREQSQRLLSGVIYMVPEPAPGEINFTGDFQIGGVWRPLLKHGEGWGLPGASRGTQSHGLCWPCCACLLPSRKPGPGHGD